MLFVREANSFRQAQQNLPQENFRFAAGTSIFFYILEFPQECNVNTRENSPPYLIQITVILRRLLNVCLIRSRYFKLFETKK